MANNDLKIFKRFRIKTNELIQDSLEFLIEKFKQARKVFTVSSPYGQLLFVQENLSQLIFYYIEDSITELNIHQATRRSSIYSLSSIAGHNPTRAMHASGEITLAPKITQVDIPGNIVIIPNHARVQCLNNSLIYTMMLPSDDVKLDTTQEAQPIIPIVQGFVETQFFTGRGDAYESFSVKFPRNFNVDEHQVTVYVNDEKWERYNNLLRVPRGAKGYFIRTGVTSGIDLFFGNDHFGRRLNRGDEVRVEYLVTEGFNGRVRIRNTEDVSFEFSETGFTTLGDEVDLNEVFNIKTELIPDFGANPENARVTKLMLPKGSETLIRLPNYEGVLERLNMFSIIKVFQSPDNERVINLFLIPDISKLISTNETYFSIPEDRFLLSTKKKEHLLSTLAKQGTRLIATETNIINPVIRRFVINVSVIIFDDIPEDQVRRGIVSDVSDYFLTVNRKKRIPRSDIIKVIEDVDGVDSVNVQIIGQQNEAAKRVDANAKEIGLDEFNDIIIRENELPIIRGGWQDRYGNIYEEGISQEGLGALNIQISDITLRPQNANN